MRRWFILGFILLIVIGIAVYYFFFKKEETEGFQSAANNVVYLLNNPSNPNGIVLRNAANSICGLLGGRLAKYSELRNKTFPNITISNAPTIMNRVRGGESNIGGFAQFIYDSDTPYNTYNGENIYFAGWYGNRNEYHSANSTAGSIPYSFFNGEPIPYVDYPDLYTPHQVGETVNYALLGLPYCYGPYPGPNVDIVIPGGSSVGDTMTVRYDVLLANGTSTSSVARSNVNQIQTQISPIQPTPGLPETEITDNYKILDLDAVYLQFQIAQIEFPIRYEAIKQKEKENIARINNNFTYNTRSPPADQRIQGGYAAINNSLGDYINFVSKKADVLAHTIWNYTPGMIVASASNGQTKITADQYSNLLLLEIQLFYDTLMTVFQSHPLSFILKGVSSVPSLLNTLPIFNPPKPGGWVPQIGGCVDWSQVSWVINNNNIQMSNPPGMAGRFVRAGGNQWNWGDDWFSVAINGTAFWPPWTCPSGYWPNHGDWETCWCMTVALPADIWNFVGFAGMPEQENYENNPQYAYNRNVLDSDDVWRPKSTDPSTANMASSVTTKFKNISFVGYISPKCFKEVQLSVSVSIRFKLQDTSSIEKQIRISSTPPNRLYMSPDASAVPEYITVNKNGNITIKPANNYHNNIHCNIEITKELFFLIPFHARKTINDFAVARYNTVKNIPLDTGDTIAKVPFGVQDLVDTGNAGAFKPTELNNTSTSAPPFSSLLETSSIYGIFFDMGIDVSPDTANPNKASRQAILDMMAQMYYEKQLSYELEGDSVVKAATPKGQSIIYKFYDVFTIGTTILDVRFEEHSKRSMEFLVALEKLEKEYNRYMAMNLSKGDLVAIEKQYITLKKELYDKDSENVWGTASNKCGTLARYVKITTDASNAQHPFNLSQIIVVDNAGKNAAWGCVVTGPPCVDFGPTSPGWPSASAVAAANAAQNLSSNSRSVNTSVVAQRSAEETKAAAAIGEGTATAIEQGIAAAAATATAAAAATPAATGDLTVIPLKIYCDSSGNLLTDRPTKKSKSSPALSNQLSQAINNEITAIRQGMEQTLTDGVMASRWYPNTYRTLQSFTVTGIDMSVGQATSGKTTTKTTSCNASNNFILVDLGSTINITAVRLVLPMDVNIDTNPKQYPNYTISLLNETKDPINNMPSVVATVPTDNVSLPHSLVALFPNNDPSAVCPNYLYDRYKVARFYFDPPPTYDHTDIRYWKISGYSLGIDSALTFNPLYNAGKQINLTLNGGNFIYKPKTISNLNLAQPDVQCENPDFVKQVFSDYRTLVNDTGFRSITGVIPELNLKPNRLYRPDIIYGFSTLNTSTCAYYWSDRAIDTSVTPNSDDSEIYYRHGSFNYVFNTEDWGALDRTFIMTSTFVLKTGAVGSIVNGKVNFSNGSSSGYSAFTSGTNPNGFITFPNPYIDSVKLDTAGGFCPALSCSDPAVMESLIGSIDPDNPGYNYIAYYHNKVNNLTSGANGFIPVVSQVYKAITPSSNECEYLVDMTDNPKVMRKLYMFINVIAPEGDKPCRWAPDRTNPNTLSLDDSLSPHMIDSVPYLTRFYNYASDVMAPYVKTVKSIVGELTTAGNAQLDPVGSGIVSALVKYRTDTKAAAGEMRYFDNIDEFGNQCADTDKLLPASSSATVPTTVNLPRCRSPNLITSLLKYYSVKYGGKRITGILGAGQTVNGECDYSFTAAPYTPTGAIDQGQGQTTGLRCSVKRIPFSCEYDVNDCSYINPTPSVGDLETYPAVGSGSTGIPAMGSGQYPSTEAAENVGPDLQRSRAGPNAIPQPPAAILDSVDWINCSSDYAKAALGVTATLTNSDYTTCKNGGTQYPFKRGDSNTNYLFSPVSTPASNTLGSLNTPVTVDTSELEALLPFIRTFSITTINAGSAYEFRVTDKDTLDFGSTYVRAEFFNGSNGKPQLKVLRAATPSESQNAFLRSPPSIDTLIAKFLDIWNNQMFEKARNKIGLKIGRITGYFMNTTNDSVVFRATAANFGNLGEYDILKYYPTAYYEVYFRKKFSDGSLMIYKTTPAPSDPVQTVNTFSLTLNTSSYMTSLGPSEPPYSVQDPARLIRDLHLMRYVRFVVKASNGGENVEIARLGFWSLAAAGTPGKKYEPISAVRGGVSVEGVLANYNLPPGTKTCKDGYTLTADPLTDIKFCQVTTPTTYPLVPNTACSLGFINMSGTCTSTGYFQELINVGSLFFGNSYTSRLRLKVNQRVTIDFNNISPIDGFSFITGSQNRLPLQWLVEGSINGVDDWIPLHNQTTNFAYNNLPNPGISAFYNPGVFQFTPSANSGADPIAQGGAYSSNVKVEGFKMKTYEMAEISDQTPTMNYRELTDQPLSTLYDSPLKAPVGKTPMFQELDMRPRIKAIRFRTLETQNPDSPFVHMSMLRFHTGSGIVPPECIQISNPQGSRRSAKDRPDSLLAASPDRRWVDYNKSELLVQFKTEIMPADPVNGIQFYVPRGFANAIEGVPAKWRVEGSYDRRTWFLLHEKVEKARIMGESSPVYRFENVQI